VTKTVARSRPAVPIRRPIHSAARTQSTIALAVVALRQTYASLCAAGGVGVREVATFRGHANTTTTEHIYTRLFDSDDHAATMAALDALKQPKALGENVVPLWR
jgi:integrase